MLLPLLIRLIYIPSTLIVSGNAVATADNIVAHETLFRLGILSDLLCGVVEIFLAPLFFLNVLNDSAGPVWTDRQANLSAALCHRWIRHSRRPRVSCTPVTFRPLDPASEKYVNLATYRRNGVEVKTPVWIAKIAERYYVFSAGDAGKVKRIRATPKVRLAACDIRGNVKSGWLEGQGRIVSDPALLLEVRRALRDKYGFLMWLTDVMATITGRMRRRAYIEIDLVARA
jgi:uncharacterized protein